MNIPLIIGSSVSLFSIITSSLLGIIELSQNYTISKLFLICGQIFNLEIFKFQISFQKYCMLLNFSFFDYILG